ncbi:MAG: hypothetical protein SFV15_14570 [Polyangiaceae bacterium]|nr:hypothetical protein [Polyangiaceae bacterium]
MKGSTDEVHDLFLKMAQGMGFSALREVVVSTKGVQPARIYAPRLDILWTMRLTASQLAALNEVGATPRLYGETLPVMAFEVEGSDASTKGMQADLANLRVSGAWFGVLAPRGGSVDNLYERGLRLHQSQEAYFGATRIMVLDARWAPELARIELSVALTELKQQLPKGSGGEADWARRTRANLREIGERAGFVVHDDARGLFPISRAPTQSKIDQVWFLPMPKGLASFVEAVGTMSPKAAVPGITPEEATAIPVVAFELENSSAKHGNGGLLNLASHGMSGVFVAGRQGSADAAEAALAAYSKYYPLAQVTVRRSY